MALVNNTTTGQNSLYSPTGQKATQANFINPYTYAQQYQPELLSDLYMRNGRGLITMFTAAIGNTRDYASDELKHAEMGRLHQVSTGVTVVGDVFTCTEAHNLRVNEEIMISDGTIEKYAIVSAVNSDVEFVAENEDDGAFGFAGVVSLFTFSNKFQKGQENFKEGKQWSPEIITNYSQILKEFYKINESDMAHLTWVEAPQFEGGYGWYNLEMGRTTDLFKNKKELTQIFGRRATDTSAAAVAGKARGLKGLVQQVEERGNLGNEYISTKEHLYEIALRLKQQGNCRVVTIWADHQQMVYFNEIAAALNGGYAGGGNYGMFQNGKEMAVNMDFKTIYAAGVTFHITALGILDDPSLLGAENFSDTSLGCLIIPSGDTTVTEDGNSVARPYFSVGYRKKNNIDRFEKTEIFGGQIGTPHKTDDMQVLFTSEQSNQLIAANNFFVIRKAAGYYS